MKRFKFFALALILGLCFITTPAHAVLQDMRADVYKWTGGMNGDGTMALTRITSGITFKVLAVDSDTSETLYYHHATTSLTNPVTTTSYNAAAICDDRINFRVDPTDATNDRYVDLLVTDTNGGFTLFYENFDQYTHSLVIDERPNIVHSGISWFTYAAGAATAIDTGINFLPKTYIQDVRVEIITVDAAITIDVGTEDDPDGFRDGVSTAVAGFIADTGVITGGSTLDHYAVSTYGALLYTAITGADGLATGGGRTYLGHFVNAAGTNDDLYYTLLTGANTAIGYIHYQFIHLR